MKSPGAPSHPREIEREFWREIAKGLLAEEAALAVGASQAVGARWFRQRGGMPSIALGQLFGRYLSFREREEIAILTAQAASVREIARRLGRAPSTISRELRRNAATRGGKLDYRASVAQWKAELVAQRPKTAKLVSNERLREYVQQRPSVAVLSGFALVVGFLIPPTASLAFSISAAVALTSGLYWLGGGILCRQDRISGLDALLIAVGGLGILVALGCIAYLWRTRQIEKLLGNRMLLDPE